MKTAFGIFAHDLKQLMRNPFALIVALGLVILPSVYAWYSVSAMWSPYSHTDGLKVAVVSEDAGVGLDELSSVEGVDVEAIADKLTGEGDSKQLNVGDLMVEAMKQDHSFDWQFVDAEQGQDGLASGDYYAEFILPESFSRDFLSVLTDKLERPTIEYWVNEKYNAVALEVTDAGAGVVDSLVNRMFSSVVADALSSIVKDVASDILTAGKTTKSEVSTGVAGAARDLETVANGLDHATESMESWRSTVADAQETLDALKETAPDLQSAIDDGKETLDDAREGAHKVNSVYSSALTEGGEALSTALGDVASDVKTAATAIADKQAEVDAELAKAEKALGECERLIASLVKIDPDSKVLDDLEEQNEQLQEQVANLEKLSKAVGDAASDADKATEAFADDLDKTIDGMEDRNDTFNEETLPRLDAGLDSMALVMGSLDGALGSLDAQIDQAKELLDQLDGVLQKTEDAISATSESLEDTSSSIRSARTDLSAFASSSTMQKISNLADIDVKSYGSFMASPVKSEIKQVYPLNSYGAGVAPFYTALAIWVGCFMLIAVVKLEADPALFPGMRPWQGYVGRLTLFGVLALLQGIVVTVGDLALGVQAVGPVSFVVAGLFTAFCFINIVYALAITFKHVGKALAVIFLIVQIPGASGMYPIQLMPEFFQALYPWLPFTYGMGAMREAIGGFYDGTYVHCLVWLLVCGLVAFALALLVRPRVLNLNRLFDRKLEAADVFITEEHGLGSDVVTEHPVMDSLLETSVGRAQLMERANRFARRYKLVAQGAPIAVVALVVCLGLVSMLLDLSVDGKLVALMVFIAAVVVIFCLCVAFEFVNDNLTAQLSALGGRMSASGSAVAASSPSVAASSLVGNANSDFSDFDSDESLFTEVAWSAPDARGDSAEEELPDPDAPEPDGELSGSGDFAEAEAGAPDDDAQALEQAAPEPAIPEQAAPEPAAGEPATADSEEGADA